MASVTTDSNAAEQPQRPLWQTPQLTEIRIEDVTDSNALPFPTMDASSAYAS